MAAKSSIVPDIIWNWVIETLATSEQTDPSTLIGLVKLAPAISSDQGKHAREAVCLRILESLFLQGDEDVVNADADEGQNGKIGFGSSERCEDVLQQILRETPEHSAKLEKEKWDVRPFLTHKRSSLPKCTLKKLKEAILESSNTLLTSLKERSKLVIPNASENANPVNDDNLDVQNQTPKSDSANLNPRKDKGKRVSVDSMENLEFVVKLRDNNVNSNALDNEHEETDSIEEHDARINGDESQTDSLVNLCVKCNSSGDLLVCSSDACPLHVHERCLGFEVTFEENGNFFCPFCAYSRAISKYQEAKKKAEKARKDIQFFSSLTIKDNRPIEKFNKQSEFEKNETTQGNVGNHSVKEGEGQKKVNEKVNVNESDLVTGGHVERHIESSKPQTSTPKRKRKEKEKEKEKESQRAIGSSCLRELRKRKAQFTPPPAIQFSRRRVIPWTKSEEEALKEGVARYSSVNAQKIPWKEILDFGHNVFDKGRTTIDLKDKWRNICKSTI